MPKCPAPYDSSLSTRSLERKRRSEERRVTSLQERGASSVEGGRPSQSELASSFPSHPSCLHEPLYTQLPASSFPSPPPDVDPAILPTDGSALLEPPIASLPPPFAHLRPPSLPASLLRPTSDILDRKKARTSQLRHLLYLKLQGNIKPILRLLTQPLSKLPLDDLQRSVLDEIVPAFDGHREPYLGLLVRRGEVETDGIVVDEGDVH